jgi:hypothetical protein
MKPKKPKRTPRSKPKDKIRARIDRTYLKGLGRRIEALIIAKGYLSSYEFWVEKSDGLFSRASLNFIVNGQKDVRITTLRIIAQCLDISLDELLKFSDRAPRYPPGDE